MSRSNARLIAYDCKINPKEVNRHVAVLVPKGAQYLVEEQPVKVDHFKRVYRWNDYEWVSSTLTWNDVKEAGILLS